MLGHGLVFQHHPLQHALENQTEMVVMEPQRYMPTMHATMKGGKNTIDESRKEGFLCGGFCVPK